MSEIRALIVRMATENRGWGYTRIQGALANLHHEISRGTIATVLLRSVLPEAFGNPAAGTWWGPFNYVATAIYAGALTLPFAAAGLAAARGDRRWRAVAVMTHASCVCAAPKMSSWPLACCQSIFAALKSSIVMSGASL